MHSVKWLFFCCCFCFLQCSYKSRNLLDHFDLLSLSHSKSWQVGLWTHYKRLSSFPGWLHRSPHTRKPGLKMPLTTVTTKCTRPNQQHTAPFFQKPQLFILLHRVVFTVKVLSKVFLLDFTLDLSMTSCIATGQIITTYKRCNGSREKLTIASQWWNCQIATKVAKKWKITSSISLARFLHFLKYSWDITVI